LEKNSSRYERRAFEKLQEYKSRQHYYFTKSEKPGPLRLGRSCKKGFVLHPIVKLCFSENSITISELKGNDIISKSIRFKGHQKIKSKPVIIKEKIVKPTIILPHEEPLTIYNYTPPSFPSSDLIDKYIEEARAEIKKK